MVNRSFKLKRSLLALVFQGLLLALIATLLFNLLTVWLWVGCMLVAVISYILCLRLPPALQLQHLDEREWTLQYKREIQPQRVKISHVIDHQLYIVVYFQHFRAKPLLIWCDQVSWKEWKNLKNLTKLV